MTIYKSEKNVTKQCHDWLKSQRDIWFLKVFGNGIQRAGIPDFIVCKNGQFYAFELKRPDENAVATERQLIEIKKINKVGGKAYVIRSINEMIEILGE